MRSLDLDVDAPDKVADVLRVAAEAYTDSAVELEGAWQDRGAGEPWLDIAEILTEAADKIDRALL